MRLGFARRLSNLLHACRAYIDQTSQRLGDLGNPTAVGLFSTLRRQAQSRDFGYRLMDGLRNHAQHRGQPVHGATFGSQWTDGREAPSRLLFSVTATIDVAELRDSPTINPKLREELSRDLTQQDAPTMVRIYLEGLGSVQDGLRLHLKDKVAAWEATVLEAIARYGSANQGNVIGLELAEFGEEGAKVSAVSLFAEMPERLQRLIRRNGSLVNLRKRVVTSDPSGSAYEPRQADGSDDDQDKSGVDDAGLTPEA